MNFFNQIINNGCSIKCYFDDLVNYPNRIGFQLTTPHNLYLYPSNDEIDNDFWLLFSFFGLKILNIVSDPFTYNIEEGYGIVLINNVRYEINLPNDIASLLHIDNYQHLNNFNFNLIHDKIIDLILEKIDHNLELKNLYYDLSLLDGPHHYITKISNNENDSSDHSDHSDNENQYETNETSDNSFGYRIGYAKILQSYNQLIISN